MGWTTIVPTRYVQNEPETVKLWGDMIANTEYNYNHALRCGTNAAGVRLCETHGEVTGTDVNAVVNKTFTGTVTFAEDAYLIIVGYLSDGTPIYAPCDPKFSAEPTVALSLEEVTAGGHDAWTPANLIWSVSTVTTAITSTGFSWSVQFVNTAGADLSFKLIWQAIGLPTAGE